MSKLRLFNAIVVSVLAVGIVLVALVLITVKVLDRIVIEEAAARNRQAEFLRAATAVSRAIVRAEDLRNASGMSPVLQEILDLRPGIRALELLEFGSGGATSVVLLGPLPLSDGLTTEDIKTIAEGGVVSRLDDSTEERAWLLAAPVISGGAVLGALRGRFSISKYDELIVAQEAVAKDVAIGGVMLTSLAFLLLVRVQLHRPISRLLATMEQVRAGNAGLQAPLIGPVEIRRLADTFNRMLGQLHEGLMEKERLLKEIRDLNDTLEDRVQRAVIDLETTSRELLAARVEAERSKKLAALGELSAVMAHELGNPLNAVSGRLQLLQAGASDDRDRHVAVIKTQIARMVDVIQHILRSTRLEAEPAAVQLNDVVVEALALLDMRGIVVTARLAPSLPQVSANKMLLHSVIVNLTTNAVQAMKGQGELTISTGLVRNEPLAGHVILQGVTADEPMARAVIGDSGPGIPSELLSRVCEPFFTTRHHEGGTGLGLAVCRRVIASAGGRLAVDSAPGKGTTFMLDLPLWRRGQ